MDELEALAAEIGVALKARGEKIAVNESSSGGLISAALLSVPGASAYYLGGAVVYTPKARVLLTDIPRAALEGMRSSSEPYALLLAQNARERYGATWGLSETGAAGPTGNGYQGWTAFRLDCQRGEMTMSLALDADDKIAGIYFKPAPRSPPNFKSFILQLFSWQHLVWLPPFFLAGLLYSWLMQKLTKRAVGISALGIHLCKGQSLILWDEINEVRPFRILYIRNLWLIRESGEKTLMHWTPLERHADLKAAVEAFAPANHPIRKHLSLLRRT